MDENKVYLLLKHRILRKIDGNWGAGDAHLAGLEILLSVNPEDSQVRELYERLYRYSKSSTIEDAKKLAEEVGLPGREKAIRAESVYRDEGKDETHETAKEIKRLFGEEFFEKWDNYIWDVM